MLLKRWGKEKPFPRPARGVVKGGREGKKNSTGRGGRRDKEGRETKPLCLCGWSKISVGVLRRWPGDEKKEGFRNCPEGEKRGWRGRKLGREEQVETRLSRISIRHKTSLTKARGGKKRLCSVMGTGSGRGGGKRMFKNRCRLPQRREPAKGIKGAWGAGEGPPACRKGKKESRDDSGVSHLRGG